MSAIYKNSVPYSNVPPVQTDWGQTTVTAPDYIKNKPTMLSDFANDLSFISQADIDRVDFWLTATKAPNVNSLTFSDSKITVNSVYEVYTSEPDLMYTDIVIASGIITVYFDTNYTHVDPIIVKVYVHNH